MATSLGIANGSATPNKTGEKGNVTNSSANTSSGALSGGKTANPTTTTVVRRTAATVVQMTAARTTMKRLFDSADTVPMSRLISRLGRQSEPLGSRRALRLPVRRQFLPM